MITTSQDRSQLERPLCTGLAVLDDAMKAGFRVAASSNALIVAGPLDAPQEVRRRLGALADHAATVVDFFRALDRAQQISVQATTKAAE